MRRPRPEYKPAPRQGADKDASGSFLMRCNLCGATCTGETWDDEQIGAVGIPAWLPAFSDEKCTRKAHNGRCAGLWHHKGCGGLLIRYGLGSTRRPGR